MRWRRLRFLLLALCVFPFGPPPAMGQAPACADSPAACKPLVKSLGEVQGCACFSCETGTETERRVCLRNLDEKKLLIQRALKDELRLKETLERKVIRKGMEKQ